MKYFTRFTLSLLLVFGLFASLGGLTPDQSAFAQNAPQADATVVVAHFASFSGTPAGSSVTVRVAGNDTLTDFKYTEVSDALSLPPGNYLVEVLPTGTSTVAISDTLTLADGMSYTVAAIGDGTNQELDLLALVDDQSAPASGGKLRIGHLAPFDAVLDNTKVDICFDAGTPVPGLTGLPYKAVTDPYLNLPAGDYDLMITVANSSCGTVALDLPPIRMMDGEIYDLFAIGDSNNVPLSYATTTGLDLTPANVKVAHFASFANTVDGTSVTVRVNGTDAIPNFKFGDITDYLEFAPDSYEIEVLPTGTSTVAISDTVVVEGGKYYTLAAIGGTLQPLELLALEDKVPANGNGAAPEFSGGELRVGHLAPFDADINNTKVDICTDDGTPVSGLTGVPYKAVTGYLPLPVGEYDLKITAAGSGCATTYLDLPKFNLGDGDIKDVFAIGDIVNLPLQYASTTGLTLLTGMVKVAHFASFANTVDGTSVTVRLNGEDKLTTFKFGDITDYLTLETGDYLVEVLPTGTSTVAISDTVTVADGMEYTVAAIGGAKQPLEIFPLVDDNTAPTSGANLRIAHFAGFDANIDNTKVDICTQDGSVVGGLTNIPYKAFTDPYVNLPAGMYDLKITAAGSGCATTLIDIPRVILSEGMVASAFAAGDIDNLAPTVFTDPDILAKEVILPVVVNNVPMGNLARVKVAHLAPFANTVDGTSVTVRVNGGDLLTNFKFGDITDGYVNLVPGDYTIQVLPSGTNTVAIEDTFTLDGKIKYTVAAIGNGTLQPLELFPMVDDLISADSGAKLRVGHLAPFDAVLDNTKVDICTDANAVVTGLAGVPYKGVTDPYLNLPAGSYDLKITAAGSSCATTYLDLPAVNLMEGGIYDLFAIGDIINLPLGIATTTGLQ